VGVVHLKLLSQDIPKRNEETREVSVDSISTSADIWLGVSPHTIHTFWGNLLRGLRKTAK